MTIPFRLMLFHPVDGYTITQKWGYCPNHKEIKNKGDEAKNNKNENENKKQK
ncbi:hypothetical protein [Acutalibacter caecimuris]|uniref:hypothetical protein n=1 Tax=Acutalibacter caecimuris TaxID=3093657 RepID=UPI002AC9EDE1|nr:hypothetical protein [Acutalibacter sp. M00118]